MLGCSLKETLDCNADSSDTIDPILAGHHRAQQSMDSSTLPFKVRRFALFIFSQGSKPCASVRLKIWSPRCLRSKRAIARTKGAQ